MNLTESIEQLGLVVEQIRQAAFADDKTPLLNASALRQEITFFENDTSGFDVVVFGDLNDLKTLNDVHGHEAGDVAINQAGEKLKQIAIDQLAAKAFRQSGDEFVIFLKKELVEVFTQEAAAFAALKFLYKDKSLIAKMSFGYAASDGKTGFSDLLERAETACQKAKAAGDGICLEWTQELEQSALIDLRGRCRKCNATIKCSVPKAQAPPKLISCPCCGELL
jgi:diguanylate cyclase (GGDEF)-like protein